jgi:hypothetical protein
MSSYNADDVGNDYAGSAEPQPPPSWMFVPPDELVEPPVETRQQLLPFDQLTWENFERLTLRLARRNGEAVHAQLYGVAGQDQQGIDLYARTRIDAGSRPYLVYQCRRIQALTPNVIEGVVRDFRRGRWFTQARRLVLATSVSAVNTRYADAVEEARTGLSADGVQFVVWDAEQLSALLTDQPEIVDAFFGRPWVRVFCGTEAVNGLGPRLDAEDVAQFRRRLGALYEAVFAQHDPGLPRVGAPIARLVDRYVMPDVLPFREVVVGHGFDEEAHADTDPPFGEDLEPGLPDSRPDLREFTLRRSPTRVPRRSGDRYVTARAAAGDWVAGPGNKVVIGPPGSGKSSLLRYLVLDLLSDEPKLDRFAESHGQRLPVWLPFAFWTGHAARHGQAGASLLSTLHAWFDQYDEAGLWPLVERALDDERLLLVVDGFDEWVDEALGRWAVDTLQVFLSQRRAACIASSRPYGLRSVTLAGADWQGCELAPLSDAQRRTLVEYWFTRAAPSAGPEAKAAANQATDGLLADLHESGVLGELAEIPLFLMLLVALRLAQVALPRGRFAAIDGMVTQLLRDHPAARRAAGAVTVPAPEHDLSDDDIREVLSAVALGMQADAHFDVAPIAAVREYARKALASEDGLALPPQLANRLARTLADVAEGQLGVLVRQGVNMVGFFHRSLQEFLAADYLARRELSEQQHELMQRATDPQWREVILALIWRTVRPADKTALIHALEAAADSEPDVLVTREILAEVAFGDYRLPPAEIRRLAGIAVDDIQRHGHLPYRRALLRHAVTGLGATATREIIAEALDRWAVRDDPYPAGTYYQMKAWPPEPGTRDVLELAILHEDAQAARVAGWTLAALYGGDHDTGTRLVRLAGHAPTVHARAAALEALGRGWPDIEELAELVSYARRHTTAALRTVALALATDMRDDTASRAAGWPSGEHSIFDPARLSEDDRAWLLSFVHRRETFSSDPWAGVRADLLLAAWAGSPQLRDSCLKVVRHYAPARGDRELAFTSLIQAFPENDEVVDLVAEGFRSDHLPLISAPLKDSWTWGLLSEHFRQHPIIAPAVADWALRRHDVVDRAYATRVAPTPQVRARLFDHLSGGNPHWAADALWQEWGEDSDVRDALVEILNGAPQRAALLAHLAPDILGAQSAYERLTWLLRQPDLPRHDFAIRGLAASCRALEPTGGSATDAAASLALLVAPSGIGAVRRDVRAEVVAGFPHSPGVRELAQDLLNDRRPLEGTLAAAYPDDNAVRQRIRGGLQSLPTPLRLDLIDHLGYLTEQPVLRLRSLSRWDHDHDPDVKIRASHAYHRLLRAELDLHPADTNLMEELDRARRTCTPRRRRTDRTSTNGVWPHGPDCSPSASWSPSVTRASPTTASRSACSCTPSISARRPSPTPWVPPGTK